MHIRLCTNTYAETPRLVMFNVLFTAPRHVVNFRFVLALLGRHWRLFIRNGAQSIKCHGGHPNTRFSDMIVGIMCLTATFTQICPV